jgi:hypothetical protein
MGLSLSLEQAQKLLTTKRKPAYLAGVLNLHSINCLPSLVHRCLTSSPTCGALWPVDFWVPFKTVSPVKLRVTTFSYVYALGSVEESDTLIEKQYGQDVIDSLSVLEAVAPSFDSGLWPRLAEILPILNLALRSRFAIIRQATARCFATICNVMTSDSMRYVVENIVPLLSDPLVLANRQGAIELIYRE